jgi:DNA polymerase elongation subunit (family B)
MIPPLENLFVLDIETVSTSPDWEQLDETWKELWAKKIDKQLPEGETPEGFYPMRAAILAEFGKVICISAGYFREEKGRYAFRIKSYSGHDEADLLKRFILDAGQWQSKKKAASFAGHNIREFDIPYLCRRLLINQMPIPDWLNFQAMKPWETNLVDTMQLWRFGDFKSYTSLNLLAACLGIPSPKGDIDGSMVGDVYWKQKDLPRIVEYCQRDVITVAQVLLKFKHLPLLVEGDVLVVGSE